MALFFSILSTLIGLTTSGFLAIMLLASAPNSKPPVWAAIKVWLIAIGLVGFIGFVGAIWFMIVRKPFSAAAIGAVPALFCIVALIIMIRTQQ